MGKEIKLLNFDDIKQESGERDIINRRHKTKEELYRERMLRIRLENHTYNQRVDKHIMNKVNKRK